MPAVLLCFWCPESPRLRQHRCPLPALHPLHCILLPPGTAAWQGQPRAAPSAGMDWLPTQLLGIPLPFLPGAPGVGLTALKSTFTWHRQWKTAPGRTKAVTTHENTEHTEQKTQEHLPCHLSSCISATLWDRHRSRRGVWCPTKLCITRNPVPRRADNGLHTDTTLPFNDSLKVSIVSFQATTPLNSGCLFFAHLLLMGAWERGPLCLFRAQSSTPHFWLLLSKPYEGLGKGNGGVFPSRSCCPLPDKSCEASAMSLLVLAVFPGGMCTLLLS